MTVTLWEERAKQFQDALHAAQGVPIFAAISGLLAKKSQVMDYAPYTSVQIIF